MGAGYSFPPSTPNLGCMNQKSNFHLLRDFRNRTEAVSTSYAVGRPWPGLKDVQLELFSKLGGHLKSGQTRSPQNRPMESASGQQ